MQLSYTNHLAVSPETNMKRFTAFIKKVTQNRDLRKKLLFTAGIFLVYRFLAHVPLPSIDIAQLRTLFASNQFLSLLNIFSGGTLANFSVVALGINPYITASIIMQLMGMVVPQIKEMQKEGESGREKVNQYTRMLTVPLAVAQSVSVLALLRAQGLVQSTEPIAIIAMIITLVAGAMIITWLGELVSQYGLGNGISIILLGAIISQLPTAAGQVLAITTTDQLLTMISFIAVFLLIIAVVVFMNESIRKIPVQYAKRQRGSRVYGGQMSHLPVKVNVAGVMPIIFAVTIMIVPSFLARILLASGNTRLLDIGQWLTLNFSETSTLYMVVYFLVVFFFSYFSALIFFNTEDISEELKKSGAFIPGIRPGGPTKKYLEFVVTRITFAGAIFLSTIAILPSIAQIFTGITALAISGTSVLIVVSVILETAKQAESMVIDQNYDQYR